MKQLILGVMLCFAVGAQATNRVQYQSLVITALNPNLNSCQSNRLFFRDLAFNLAKVSNRVINVFAVSEPRFNSYNSLVAFIGRQLVNNRIARVVVRNRLFVQLGIRRFNQTRVACIAIVRDNYGQIISQKIVALDDFFGLLVGSNARGVKLATSVCRG